jgi:hypothetical protein
MTSLSTSKKRRRQRIALLMLGVLPLALLADYALYPLLPVGGKSWNRGQNAIWLRDSWWRGTETESVDSLATRLQKNQLQTAYFHVRFIQKNGELRFRGPEYSQRARRFNAQLKQRAPQIKSLAWIYVGNERGLTGVDISQPKTRRAMVAEAQWLAQNCGFDGVQWDYEICDDGDENLLALLRETRAAIGKNKTLSISTPMWLPRGLESWGWSENYFSRVAKECDEIAVVTYDSALVFPRHYVWLLEQQMVRVPRAAKIGNPTCRVLLGVPTYEDGGHSHQTHSENLKMALKAARRAGSTPDANLAGLAIFADYTTDGNEWKLWRELWLGEHDLKD